jgi:hypothetical protein
MLRGRPLASVPWTCHRLAASERRGRYGWILGVGLRLATADAWATSSGMVTDHQPKHRRSDRNPGQDGNSASVAQTSRALADETPCLRLDFAALSRLRFREAGGTAALSRPHPKLPSGRHNPTRPFSREMDTKESRVAGDLHPRGSGCSNTSATGRFAERDLARSRRDGDLPSCRRFSIARLLNTALANSRFTTAAEHS